VGEEFVSDPHLITPEDLDTYAYAVDDHHSWLFGPSPFGGPVAPTNSPKMEARLRISMTLPEAWRQHDHARHVARTADPRGGAIWVNLMGRADTLEPLESKSGTEIEYPSEVAD
jgi:hypothetical protein